MTLPWIKGLASPQAQPPVGPPPIGGTMGIVCIEWQSGVEVVLMAQFPVAKTRCQRLWNYAFFALARHKVHEL